MPQSGYTPIVSYHSTTAAAVPLAANLASGELAINIADGVIFYKDSGGVVQEFTSGGSGAGGAIVTNLTTASASYVFPSGTNGFSVGPVTISSSITVTVTSGQRWVVI